MSSYRANERTNEGSGATPPLTCPEVVGVTITFKRHQFSALCILSAGVLTSHSSSLCLGRGRSLGSPYPSTLTSQLHGTAVRTASPTHALHTRFSQTKGTSTMLKKKKKPAAPCVRQPDNWRKHHGGQGSTETRKREVKAWRVRGILAKQRQLFHRRSTYQQ